MTDTTTNNYPDDGNYDLLAADIASANDDSASRGIVLKKGLLTSVNTTTKTIALGIYNGDGTTTAATARYLNTFTPVAGKPCWYVNIAGTLLVIGQQTNEIA